MTTNGEQAGLRMSNDGLEADEGAPPRSKSGFGDTRKVAVLGALVLVGVVVFAYQFTGGGGPKPAAGSPAAVAPGAPPTLAGPLVQTIDTVLKGGAAGGAAAAEVPVEDRLSVERVEALVQQFDTYVQQRQVPAKDLRVNPFEVAEQAAKDAAEAEGSKDVARAEAERQRQARRQAAAQLKVGTVLLAGESRLAVIAGKPCRVGDTVEGFRVVAIEADRVTLGFGDDTVDLLLKPDAQRS